MYYGFHHEFNCSGPMNRSPANAALHRAAISSIVPVEICGEKGDVIWWHGKTLRECSRSLCVFFRRLLFTEAVGCTDSAGIHTGDTVRLAIPADFQQLRETVPKVRPAWPLKVDYVNNLEWFKDTLPFAEDKPPQPDMWASWGEAMR